MHIVISQLDSNGREVEESWGAEALAGEAPRGRARGVSRKGTRLDLRAWVRSEGGGRAVRASGEVAGEIEAECDRCLAPVVVDVERSFDQRYVVLPADAPESAVAAATAGESELGREDLDVSPIVGDDFDTNELAREQLELAAPIRVLCSQECLGLCEACGTNRNVAPCRCADEATDMRWDALKRFRDTDA